MSWTVCGLLLVGCGPGLSGVGGGDDDGTTTAVDGGDSDTDSGPAPDMGGDTTGPGCEPGTLECPCLPGGECDEDLWCEDGLCVEPPTDCGNGVIDEGEECDDGNSIPADGCNPDCVPSAEEQWSEDFENPEGGDIAQGVAVDQNGDIVVAGHITPMPGSSDHDIWVGKFSAEGELLWSDARDEGGLDDRAYAVAVTQDGDYVVAGHTVTIQTDCDIFVARYTAEGDEVWTRKHDKGAGFCDAAFGITVRPDGRVVVVGHEAAAFGESDMWVRAYLPDGTEDWTATLPGALPNGVTIGMSVASTPENGVWVAGEDNSGLWGGGRERILLHYSAGGELLAQLTDPEDLGGTLYGVAMGSQGGVIVAGAADTNARLWRLTTELEETWTTTIGGDIAVTEVGEAVAVDSAGNVVLVGRHNPNWDHDALIAKYGPDGDELWIQTFDGEASSHDRAYSVAIAEDDYIVVAGMTTLEGQDANIWVAKYSP